MAAVIDIRQQRASGLLDLDYRPLSPSLSPSSPSLAQGREGKKEEGRGTGEDGGGGGGGGGRGVVVQCMAA